MKWWPGYVHSRPERHKSQNSILIKLGRLFVRFETGIEINYQFNAHLSLHEIIIYSVDEFWTNLDQVHRYWCHSRFEISHLAPWMVHTRLNTWFSTAIVILQVQKRCRFTQRQLTRDLVIRWLKCWFLSTSLLHLSDDARCWTIRTERLFLKAIDDSFQSSNNNSRPLCWNCPYNHPFIFILHRPRSNITNSNGI
jgi:hypothetical protein